MKVPIDGADDIAPFPLQCAGHWVIDSPELTLPHPLLHLRHFALRRACELASPHLSALGKQLLKCCLLVQLLRVLSNLAKQSLASIDWAKSLDFPLVARCKQQIAKTPVFYCNCSALGLALRQEFTIRGL